MEQDEWADDSKIVNNLFEVERLSRHGREAAPVPRRRVQARKLLKLVQFCCFSGDAWHFHQFWSYFQQLQKDLVRWEGLPGLRLRQVRQARQAARRRAFGWRETRGF